MSKRIDVPLPDRETLFAEWFSEGEDSYNDEEGLEICYSPDGTVGEAVILGRFDRKTAEALIEVMKKAME